MREIFFAGEEAQERPALLRDVVPDCAAQHGMPSLERVEDRALRNRNCHLKLHLAVHLG